jgi:ectoine hydroxylase-related dioxygenase (phytanoyl-CoA dioxygenase family)
MTRRCNPSEQFERDGRVWLRNALLGENLIAFDRAWDLGARPGARLATTGPLSKALAFDSPLSAIVAELLPLARAVRVISFNKTPQNNWGVPWHQDRVISVREKHALPGYGNWSQKNGIWHCEPPLALLDRMLFVRLHLDDTDNENGAMQIVPGSHKEGVIPADSAAAFARSRPTEICHARRGDVWT